MDTGLGKGRDEDQKQDGKKRATKHEKHWTESGRGDGQGDME